MSLQSVLALRLLQLSRIEVLQLSLLLLAGVRDLVDGPGEQLVVRGLPLLEGRDLGLELGSLRPELTDLGVVGLVDEDALVERSFDLDVGGDGFELLREQGVKSCNPTLVPARLLSWPDL